MMLSTFRRSLRESGRYAPDQISFEDYNTDNIKLKEKILATQAECIILFCKPEASLKLSGLLRESKISRPVYGIPAILNESEISSDELKAFDNILRVPAGEWSLSAYQLFKRDYRNTYGIDPGMVAAYAFDAMNTLIEAIITAGSPDREKIQEALKIIRHDGVTGKFHFDARGNRVDQLRITQVKNGIPEMKN
jgi:ABC-type branched-subunit amino acid transport system substrate-binding protein